MKFLTRLLFVSFVTLLAAGISTAQTAPKQPVYIYLHARVTDQVNLDLSEDRLRRILPMLERFRKEHPEANVSATVLLSGAISQALAEGKSQLPSPASVIKSARPPGQALAPGSAHANMKDFVLDYARRGVVELGYDGTDEPTYEKRPLPDYTKAKNPMERWLARTEAAEKFLTEARDVTGHTQASMAGGLKKMQEVFGKAVCITGVTREMGGDTEFVQRIGAYNAKAIMFGLLDTDPRYEPDVYEKSAEEFGKIMSPIPQTSPELYWQDNVLRTSETSDEDMRVVRGYEGVKGIEGVLGKLDRSKIRIVHVEVGSDRIYLRPAPWYPPLELAYANPEDPELPASSLRDADEVNASYAKEEALLKWLVEDFFPANPGSRFVSSTDLVGMTPPSSDFSISVDSLRAALAEHLKTWNASDTVPPMFLRVDGHYLSLADMFQVTADALADLYMKGKLPQSVRVVKVYGPMEMEGGHGPAQGEVTFAALIQLCLGISGRLHDTSAAPLPLPKNAIPSRVLIGGVEINAAQFFRLMAEALVATSQETKLKVKMTQMFTAPGLAFPRKRPLSDEGASWTFKPAPIQVGPSQQTNK